MSARDHDFGNAMANSFYSQDMKDLAAAEHAIHVILSRHGYRSVYPKINHGKIFGQSTDIANHVESIFDCLQQSGSSRTSFV